MQGQVESGSAIAPLGGALALGLALRRSQGWLRHRALLATLPFLALGGRWWSHAGGAVRGRGNWPAMPWSTPRWFGWPAQDVPPTRTAESGSRLPGGAASSGPSPSADLGPAQRLETLATLAPALRWAGRGAAATSQPPRPGMPWKPTPTTSAGTVVGRELRIQRSPSGATGPAGSAPLSNRSPAERAGPETDTAVGGEAGRPETRVPDVVGSLMPRLSAATPTWRLLNVLPGLAFGAAPAGLPAGGARQPTPPRQPAHRVLSAAPRRATPFGLSWLRVYGGGIVGPQGRPSAPSPVGAGTLPPLPERKPHAGREPGPYAPTSLQGLAVVAGAVEHLVEREVKAEVRRQREEIQSQAPGRPDARSSPMAVDVTSDEVVQALMQKMRALAREERFRLGQLR